MIFSPQKKWAAAVQHIFCADVAHVVNTLMPQSSLLCPVTIAYRLTNHPLQPTSLCLFLTVSLFFDHPTYHAVCIRVPEHARSTLTNSQPADGMKMEVMRSCADTRSQRRNKLGYSSLSNHKLLSSACRLNTLAHRQARIVFVCVRECTQSKATTHRDIKNTMQAYACKEWQTYCTHKLYYMLRKHSMCVICLWGHSPLWWP